MSNDQQPGDGAGELSESGKKALETWSVPEPPAGFADRVMQARAAGRSDQPTDAGTEAPGWLAGWRKWAVVASVAVAGLVVWRVRSEPVVALSGQARPSERQSIDIGRRAVAVAEAGAELSWTGKGTRVAVAQAAGSVFYRVAEGGHFRVETPYGTVRVTGTCFRVEVDMNGPWRAVAGAAAGVALTVTVYEGSVLFADKHGGETAVGPGQVVSADHQGKTSAGGAGASSRPGPAADDLPPAPLPDASREDLLARDVLQRQEIAELRNRLREVEQGTAMVRGGGSRDSHDSSGRPWFDPSKEDLIRFAEECRVRYDLPPIMNTEPMQLDARQGAEMGLSEEERAGLNQIIARMHRDYVAQLRELYIEITGDAAGADSLSPEALASELRDKSPPGERSRANQRIAQERAGLAQPPADLSSLSPVERYLRLQAAVGDQIEQEFGKVIGAGRARELRERNGGWGMRSEWAGCPRTGEAELDVEQ